MIAKEKSAL